MVNDWLENSEESSIISSSYCILLPESMPLSACLSMTIPAMGSMARNCRAMDANTGRKQKKKYPTFFIVSLLFVIE